LYADEQLQSVHIPAAKETYEDVPSSKPARGVKRKKTAHLTVKKRRTTTPPPPTASFGVTPMKVKISPHSLTPGTNRVFFESVSHLLTYVNTTEKTADLESINGRIKQLAYHGLFPPERSLSELVESKEKNDIRVSWSLHLVHYPSYNRQLVKKVKRGLKLILNHLKTERDCEQLVDKELTLEAIRSFQEQCGRYLQLT
jgi:hypothetical protein